MNCGKSKTVPWLLTVSCDKQPGLEFRQSSSSKSSRRSYNLIARSGYIVTAVRKRTINRRVESVTIIIRLERSFHSTPSTNLGRSMKSSNFSIQTLLQTTVHQNVSIACLNAVIAQPLIGVTIPNIPRPLPSPLSHMKLNTLPTSKAPV